MKENPDACQAGATTHSRMPTNFLNRSEIMRIIYNDFVLFESYNREHSNKFTILGPIRFNQSSTINAGKVVLFFFLLFCCYWRIIGASFIKLQMERKQLNRSMAMGKHSQK